MAVPSRKVPWLEEWLISNFPCNLTRNITSGCLENLANFPWFFYQFWLPHLYISHLEGWENVLSELEFKRVEYVVSPWAESARRAYIVTEIRESCVTSFSPGIGQGRVTANLQGAPIDDALAITDRDAVEMVRGILVRRGCLFSSDLYARACRHPCKSHDGNVEVVLRWSICNADSQRMFFARICRHVTLAASFWIALKTLQRVAALQKSQTIVRNGVFY